MSTTPFVYNWGLPGINIPAPLTRDGYGPSAVPIQWSRLKFSPIGLYDLRRRQGVLRREPGVFQQFRQRFITSDIAWFAAGASTDGRHIPGHNSFFPEFDALRHSLPTGRIGSAARKDLNDQLETAVFDLATCWDRTFGGSTIIMHISGTTVPNTPSQPQFLRCSAYIPPSFLADNPASHGPIAKIVQTFIESVGIPTVQQWRNNANHRGWSLTQSGPGVHPNAASSVLIPAPSPPDSAHYKFNGRPFGVLDDLLATMAPALGPVIIPDDDDDDDEYDDTTMDLIAAVERLGYAEARVRELEEQEEILVSQVAALEVALEKSCQSLRVALGNSVSSTPTTPLRSQPLMQPSASRRPPPYSPSTNRTSRIAPVASSSHLVSPVASSSRRMAEPRSPTEPSGLESFIRAHDLQESAIAIRWMMHSFHPAKWQAELLELDISGSLASELLDVLSEN
ncbi:hypothetical protein B0H17DRAFT_1197452 [Mycena rosella]|uniref:Uncharacterized protein n=1 Tax=Mycena rosella TaxID=1033263 RepID=A0AAD7GM46_MYCRO|nr:hypothetical protein B0H17DRAFT_1197452 [Mycena rosella]